MTTPEQPSQHTQPDQPEVLRDRAPRARRNRPARTVRSLAGLAVVALVAGAVAVAASLVSGGPSTSAGPGTLGDGSVGDQVADPDAPPWAPNGAWVSHEADMTAALELSAYWGEPGGLAGLPEEELWDRNERVRLATDALGFGPSISDGSEPYVEPVMPAGYTGIVVDPAGLRVTLWIVGGTWPQDLLDAAAASYPDVRVDVRDAPVDRETLTTLMEERSFLAVDGVHSASFREDGTAIVLAHEPGTDPDVDDMAREIGVPIILVEEPAPVEAVALAETVG